MALTLGPSVHPSLRVPILCNHELQQLSLNNVKTLHNDCIHIEDVHFLYYTNWNNKTRIDVYISMFDITCRRMYLVSVGSMLLIFCSCLCRVFYLFAFVLWLVSSVCCDLIASYCNCKFSFTIIHPLHTNCTQIEDVHLLSSWTDCSVLEYD